MSIILPVTAQSVKRVRNWMQSSMHTDSRNFNRQLTEIRRIQYSGWTEMFTRFSVFYLIFCCARWKVLKKWDIFKFFCGKSIIFLDILLILVHYYTKQGWWVKRICNTMQHQDPFYNWEWCNLVSNIVTGNEHDRVFWNIIVTPKPFKPKWKTLAILYKGCIISFSNLL